MNLCQACATRQANREMEPTKGWGTGRCERCGKRTLVAPEDTWRAVPEPAPYYAAMGPSVDYLW